MLVSYRSPLGGEPVIARCDLSTLLTRVPGTRLQDSTRRLTDPTDGQSKALSGRCCGAFVAVSSSLPERPPTWWRYRRLDAGGVGISSAVRGRCRTADPIECQGSEKQCYR